MFDREALAAIVAAYSDDREALDMIFDATKSFEEYHSAIYEMESRAKIYSYENMSKEDYQDMLTNLDKTRTARHNKVLASVNMLNRMAEKKGLAPVYDGVVSEERPYRREVANAILAYAEELVRERR